ncbi:MAG TPA: fused MFS/spermidine synthase [Thermoanaerobaculia bacterium]|nr:fused MFS/spermidine synthase [Thermoanaerobaculia bacterium]
MNKTWAVASLLFVSGLCALVYQTVWMRELRLVFGASTLAGAAVLAIFMGGLGAGAAILGKRADTHEHPLRFYGLLEIGIAISAALTPWLIDGVRVAYIASGGSIVLRFALAALVLALPTFLMGATLSAAARSIAGDSGRRSVALLYAMNTAGAVTGAVVAGFILLERYGNRQTLFTAAGLNLAIGVAARFSRSTPPRSSEEPRGTRGTRGVRPLPRTIVCAAAAITGFVFLLMELVWYRMLSPLLGGTTFMFALVLAMALAGIGIGGGLYARWRGTTLATSGGLAIALALEAFALGFPYAIGDRIALLALKLHDVTTFAMQIAGWAIVTAIVVLPAAIVAGVQFPLLIALLGEGREDVGRDVGSAYAWNTAGAIGGSLAGGFALIPYLGATGCWRLCVAMLVALAAVFAWRAQRTSHLLYATLTGGVAVLVLFAAGPTAVWRHSGIGAGRAPQLVTAADSRVWMNSVRRTFLTEAEGRESSIALLRDDDLGLIMNGKSDGSARRDAGTQVMAGMIAALLHPQPRTAMIVGLGTGTTAGWLADVPSMQRVDVVELEPAVIRMAREYARVNRDVLDNPKAHVTEGDARERLLVSRARYDIIFSEPSNPYRAGVASLYTREFYQAAAARLARSGIFAQWVQTYSIDAATARTIYATLTSVFPHVQTWTTNPGDVVLLASREPIVLDANAMRRRLQQEPFRGAAHAAWRIESAEGVLAHFIANEDVAAALSKDARELNTDDRQVIEFGFARSLGRDTFGTMDILKAAGDRPRSIRGAIQWDLVAANRASLAYLPSEDARNTFARMYAASEFGNAAAAWRALPWTPANSRQLASVAHVLALAGDERAEGFAKTLRAWQPAEADAIVGILRYRQDRVAESRELIASALMRYRTDPWPMRGVMESTLAIAATIADARILEALSVPYAVYQLEEVRRFAYVAGAWADGRCNSRTLGALAAFEPHPPWVKEILQMRALCYETVRRGELAVRARKELTEFEKTEATQIASR